MQNTKRTFLILLLAFLCIGSVFVLNTRSNSDKDAPVARNGKIDLQQWDRIQHPTIPLNGTWNLYLNRFRNDLSDKDIPLQVATPITWDQIGKHNYSPFGYGTYRLMVTGLSPQTSYGLKLADQATSFRLFVNGNEIASNGNPGKTAEATIPEWYPTVATFETDSTGNADFILEISNFEYNSGGMWNSILLGNVDDIMKCKMMSINIEVFLATGIFVLGLFFMGIFFMHPVERLTLYFSIFCLNAAAYTLTTGERFLTQLIPHIAWNIVIRAEYALGYLIFPLYAIYLVELFKDFAPPSAKYIFRGLAVFSVAFPLIFPHTVYIGLLYIYEFFMVVGSSFFLYLFARALRARFEGVLLMIFACAVLFVGLLSDIFARSDNTGIPFATFIFVLCFSLITIRKYSWIQKKNTLLESKVYRDPLTTLYNREFIFHYLSQKIYETNVEEPCYILFMDLDAFKPINDTYGHETGDVVLKETARRLKSQFRSSDLVCRYGGDEFLVFVQHNTDTEIQALANRVIRVLSQPYHIPSGTFTVGISIGISHFPTDSSEIGTLIAYSDEAMYRSKQQGGNTWTLYDTSGSFRGFNESQNNRRTEL